GIGERVGIDGPALHVAHREALHRARGAELVTAAWEHRVIEAAAGEQRRRDRNTERHREWHRLRVLVVLGHDLPHVTAGRGLERADVAPAEVHAVVADVAPAVEVITDDDAVARTDRDLRLENG